MKQIEELVCLEMLLDFGKVKVMTQMFLIDYKVVFFNLQQ